MVRRVIERFGRLDVLVNNAGIGTNGAAEEISVALALCGQRRLFCRTCAPQLIFDDVVAASMTAGDGPAVVAKVIVTAATELKPELRSTAGPAAGASAGSTGWRADLGGRTPGRPAAARLSTRRIPFVKRALARFPRTASGRSPVGRPASAQ
jgi:NAD(P)-dependent dehydrogenase (short-subunit alcohol dehydrogenase family)